MSVTSVRTHGLSLGAFYTPGVLELFTLVMQAWCASKAFYVRLPDSELILAILMPVQTWSVILPWGV
jgi:hypothetical protein